MAKTGNNGATEQVEEAKNKPNSIRTREDKKDDSNRTGENKAPQPVKRN
jgi:hypothetical protein